MRQPHVWRLVLSKSNSHHVMSADAAACPQPQPQQHNMRQEAT
ncbi:unnamed protein product, partial [Callosobruchus maculatus]